MSAKVNRNSSMVLLLWKKCITINSFFSKCSFVRLQHSVFLIMTAGIVDGHTLLASQPKSCMNMYPGLD